MKILHSIQPVNILAALLMLVSFCLLQLSFTQLETFDYRHIITAIIGTTFFSVLMFLPNNKKPKKQPSIARSYFVVAFMGIFAYFTNETMMNSALYALTGCSIVVAILLSARPQPSNKHIVQEEVATVPHTNAT